MSGHDTNDDDGAGTASQRLTNDDFRKLLMTPRTSGASGASGAGGHAVGSIREAMASAGNATASSASAAANAMPPPSERHEARRKKKNFYAALKKQEDTKLQELADKYRDRARERRDGDNPDYLALDASGATAGSADARSSHARNHEQPAAGSGYRAVAPDIKSGLDAAERRRQMIQESKFLGGDMEHTHLVKGLDYALLQKVRSEIVVKEHEQEVEMEKLAEEAEEKEKERAEEELERTTGHQPDEEPAFRTILGRNVLNTIAYYRSRHVEKNELFAAGRMAYVIELDEEQVAETGDIPTTLIRSKADVPVSDVEVQTLTTNDIVINKLAQILSYLRQGGRGKKNKKRDKDKLLVLNEPSDELGKTGASGRSGDIGDGDNGAHHQRQRPAGDVSIYDDVGDYRVSTSNGGPSRRGGDSAGAMSSKSGDAKSRQYFDKSSEQEEREAGGLTRKRLHLWLIVLCMLYGDIHNLHSQYRHRRRSPPAI